MLIYVAGKYSAPTKEGVQKNIDTAMVVAEQLWEQGHWVICPHGNSAGMKAGSYEQYLLGDLHMMAMCDGVVFLPEWEESNGAKKEMERCLEWNIPVYYWPCDVPHASAHQKYPVQTLQFRAMLGKMYRTHLKKNNDYSSSNISITGEVGLITRLSDKLIRLLNLSGFDFNVSIGTFNKPQNANNESIDDTLLDLANYGVIGSLLRQGLWGR